jgi:hypothetical protein
VHYRAAEQEVGMGEFSKRRGQEQNRTTEEENDEKASAAKECGSEAEGGK